MRDRMNFKELGVYGLGLVCSVMYFLTMLQAQLTVNEARFNQWLETHKYRYWEASKDALFPQISIHFSDSQDSLALSLENYDHKEPGKHEISWRLLSTIQEGRLLRGSSPFISSDARSGIRLSISVENSIEFSHVRLAPESVSTPQFELLSLLLLQYQPKK